METWYACRSCGQPMAHRIPSICRGCAREIGEAGRRFLEHNRKLIEEEKRKRGMLDGGAE